MSCSKNGWVTMSERDLKRIEVLSELLVGRKTVGSQRCIGRVRIENQPSTRSTGKWFPLRGL